MSRHHWTFDAALKGSRCVCGLERHETGTLGYYVYKRNGREVWRGRRAPQGPCRGAPRG